MRVSPVAVTHGSLTVTITAQPQVSQPAPLSRGETVVVPASEISVLEACCYRKSSWEPWKQG